MTKQTLFIAILLGSTVTSAKPIYLAAPERDGSDYWVCFNSNSSGWTYGAPVHDDNCFAGYKVETDSRGNWYCYRRDAKNNAYGAPVDARLCNQ